MVNSHLGNNTGIITGIVFIILQANGFVKQFMGKNGKLNVKSASRNKCQAGIVTDETDTCLANCGLL